MYYLNTVEHLWIELKDQLENCNIKIKKVVEVWETIPISVIQKLIEMMPRHLQAVIDTNGNAIKY